LRHVISKRGSLPAFDQEVHSLDKMLMTAWFPDAALGDKRYPTPANQDHGSSCIGICVQSTIYIDSSIQTVISETLVLWAWEGFEGFSGTQGGIKSPKEQFVKKIYFAFLGRPPT
jgi:hypothetical protein